MGFGELIAEGDRALGGFMSTSHRCAPERVDIPCRGQ